MVDAIMRVMNGAVHFLIQMTSLAVAMIFHEQWHARVALWLGDPTAKAENRLSWNPRYHIDPIMSIALPLLTYFTMGLPFGGAKPVRVNIMNFRHPYAGNALVAAAGPLSNLFLAALSFGIILLFWACDRAFLYDGGERVTYNAVFLFSFAGINVMLAAFNILPLPGLDGSRILYLFLPRGGRALLDLIEPYALFVTFLLLRAGAGSVLGPASELCDKVLLHIFDPNFLDALGRAFSGK